MADLENPTQAAVLAAIEALKRAGAPAAPLEALDRWFAQARAETQRAAKP